jgi:hypothetical protein
MCAATEADLLLAGDLLSKNSEGGIFNCKLKFPESYPDNPPKMKFVTPIWHPNVYQNGDVCISILHPPGDDATNPQESASMRWNPIHTVNLCAQWRNPGASAVWEECKIESMRGVESAIKAQCQQCQLNVGGASRASRA